MSRTFKKDFEKKIKEKKAGFNKHMKKETIYWVGGAYVTVLKLESVDVYVV